MNYPIIITPAQLEALRALRDALLEEARNARNYEVYFDKPISPTEEAQSIGLAQGLERAVNGLSQILGKGIEIRP